MLVEAYSTNTGAKRMIPEHWLTTEAPAIKGRFSKTPRQKAADKLDGPPSDAWTIAQLTQHAGDNGIDLAGATRKDDILAAINTHQPEIEPGSGTPADADNT